MKPALSLALLAATTSAQQLHDDLFIFDAHVHIINRQFADGRDIGHRYPDGQVDLPRIREGGVDAFFMSIGISEKYYPGRFETKQALRLMDLAINQIEKHEEVSLALNAEDIERINSEGKTAAVLDIEGGPDMDGDLGVLRSLYRLGLRVLQLPAHNWANEYADSCCAPHKWNGVNEHGKRFIAEMNRLGMIINVSHSSDETLDQAIDASEDPLVATHHGLRHYNDIPRVMPDHLLRKLVSKGGLIGFHIGQSFHSRKFFDWKTDRDNRPFWDTSDVEKSVLGLSIHEIDETLKSRYPSVGPIPPDEIWMTPDEWLERVERAIEIAGENHVILGTDFDGGPTPPQGIEDISDLHVLTETMQRRGWPESRIRKFMGENLLRVFRQVTQ